MGDMSSFIRESVANDNSDDDDHITLSLGCLDTELSDNAVELENTGEESPGRRRRSVYAPREQRWPPTPRRSSRESTRRSTQASTSRPPTPPRTRATSRRRRRQCSPSYSPPPRIPATRRLLETYETDPSSQLPTSLLLQRARAAGTPRTLRSMPPGAAATGAPASIFPGARIGARGPGVRGAARRVRGSPVRYRLE